MIDESYGIGPDDDDEVPYAEETDEAGDACQHWDNVREERRIAG